MIDQIVAQQIQGELMHTKSSDADTDGKLAQSNESGSESGSDSASRDIPKKAKKSKREKKPVKIRKIVKPRPPLPPRHANWEKMAAQEISITCNDITVRFKRYLQEEPIAALHAALTAKAVSASSPAPSSKDGKASEVGKVTSKTDVKTIVRRSSVIGTEKSPKVLRKSLREQTKKDVEKEKHGKRPRRSTKGADSD